MLVHRLTRERDGSVSPPGTSALPWRMHRVNHGAGTDVNEETPQRSFTLTRGTKDNTPSQRKEGTMPTAASASTTASIPSITVKQASGFQLRFDSLFTRHALSFPCDASGVVDLEALSERARGNLARARNGVGRDYGMPQVLPIA